MRLPWLGALLGLPTGLLLAGVDLVTTILLTAALVLLVLAGFELRR